jgi:hypothetical protein
LRGAVGCVQVVIRHLAYRGFSLGARIDRIGLLEGIGSEKIVERVPTRLWFVDQVRPGQFCERRPHLQRRRVDHAGRGDSRDLRSWVQRQQTEQSRRRCAQVLIRPREDAPRTGAGIVTIERVEAPVGLRELFGNHTEREIGTYDSLTSDNAQRKGKSPTTLDDAVRRVRFSPYTVLAKVADQQLTSFVLSKDVEVDPRRTDFLVQHG